MATAKIEENNFSDEDLEEIMDMQAPKALIKEFEATVKERPLLVTGLVFAFGLLLGASLCSHRKSK
jgi:uncharacterized membrane protein YsdA (DUF1294 family)